MLVEVAKSTAWLIQPLMVVAAILRACGVGARDA